MEEEELRYDGRVAVVTGAGNGLGKQYALYFASKGAKVVVNDLGGNIKGGDGNDSRVADVVVEEIRALGGTAVPNYDPVQNGANIIQTAIEHFGRIDILINNAGILCDTTLKNMKDADWDILMEVHMLGTLRTTLAAWPYFLRQGYGRIINTTSSSGLFGNFGQSNYAMAKMAIFGFSKAVALEGAHKNIRCNVLAPSAASRLTATVWTPEMMEAMSPDWVVPLVGVLAHEECMENEGVFLAGAGHFSKIRWERSNLNADGVRGQIRSSKLPQGQVAVIGVAGIADERLLALVHQLQRSGTQVVIWTQEADGSIRRMEQQGVTVITDIDAQKVVQDILRTHGRIDILINYLSIEQSQERLLEDVEGDRWATTFTTSVRRIFVLTRAVWPAFVKAEYGRVVNVLSTSGIDGASGHTISSAAGCGLIGFTKTISREGQKYNIIVNAVAQPSISTQPDSTQATNALIEALCSEQAPATGQLYEVDSTNISSLRWQRSGGVDFDYENRVPSARAVAGSFDRICDFDDGRADHPATPAEGSGHIHTKGTESAKRIAQAHSDRKEPGKLTIRHTSVQQQKGTSKL